MGKTKKECINLKIDTEDLTDAQIRLIKTINSMLLHVVTTQDENEFFDASADVMRICAALIKQANFSHKLKSSSNIPYAEQAIEYSMDTLMEQMNSAKLMTYDN